MFLSTTVCQNLGPNETRKRRLFGMLWLMVGLVLALVYVLLDASELLRLLVFIPFLLGFLGILQAMHKTCVVLAMQGKQNNDQGSVDVVDSALSHNLKIRSYWILFFSIALALLCACMTMFIRTDVLQGAIAPPLPR